MKNLSILAFLLLSYAAAHAQYNLKENNVWQFGFHAGLDFNSGSPVPIQSAINGNGTPASDPNGQSSGVEIEASASVCDSNGQLLFYSSGDTIWNKNNQPMPNGYHLTPVAAGTPCSQDTGSINYVLASDASQGALIVPVLNNPNQYYVFSLQRQCFSDPLAGRLFYSVVDMSLNGGLGDVVPNQQGMLLATALSEKMIAIPGDNCDIWVLVHGNQNDSFFAFEVTTAGINTVPVASVSGNIIGAFSYTLGDMEVSPSRKKIAVGSVGYFAAGGVGMEMVDFDPATGIASNPITISTNPTWGMCFSPDNSKLYSNEIEITVDTSSETGELYIAQYDLNQPTTAAIINSRVNIFDGGVGSFAVKDLRLAPDRKIYLGSEVYYSDSNALDRIDFPNLAGAACHYVQGAVLLNPNMDSARISSGLPNMYQVRLKDTINTITDTNLSAGNFTIHLPTGFPDYYWSDGTSDSVKVISNTGTYTVVYTNYCTYHADTFYVHATAGVTNVTGGETATLNVYPSPAQNVATVTLNGINKVNGTLRITDAVGRVIAEQVWNNNKQVIDLSNIAAGVYNITYTDKTLPVRLQQKLVITK